MVRKILIIGPSFYNYTQSLNSSFVRLGFTTLLREYTSFPNGFAGKIASKFAADSIQTGIYNYEVKRFNKQLLLDYLEFRPDIVIVIKGDILSEMTLRQMSNSYLICWMQDSIFRYNQCLENARYYDTLFMFEGTDVEKLKEMGVKSFFLPMAYDDEIYYPINSNKDIDVLFIGTLKGDRLKILKYLISSLPDFSIHVYGKYLSKSDLFKRCKYIINKEYRQFKNRDVTPECANILYSRAKIALNIHISQSNYGCNPRLYEILATKTFQLVNSNGYIADEFDQDVVMFNSIDELVEKTKYFLFNEEERTRIAERGYSSVRVGHTFVDRAKEILCKSNIWL